MTSIRNALALGALASAAVLVDTHPAPAAGLSRGAAPQPVPAAPAAVDTVKPSPLLELLSLGIDRDDKIPPGFLHGRAVGRPAGRPPVSQPIPGPVIPN